MNYIKKTVCVLLSVIIVFSSALFAFAENTKVTENDKSSDVVEIELKTNKTKYRTTSTAKLTVTVTNTGNAPLYNVKSQAIFNELTPVNKKNSTTQKSAECLQSGDSFSYSYRVLLNAEEFEVNIFSKLLLAFKNFFKGAYHIESADHTGQDITVLKHTDEISFGKFNAENLVEVAYSTKKPTDPDEDGKKDNSKNETDNKLTETTTETTTAAEKTTAPPPITKTTENSSEAFYPVEREKMYSDDYILPTDLRYITNEDLDKFDYYEMDYVTNEIYARHGYIFKTEKFARYFESKDWYKGTETSMSEVEEKLSTIERKNLDTIIAYEKALGWREQDTTQKATEPRHTTPLPSTTKKQSANPDSREAKTYSKYISFLKENASSIGQCDAADINGDGILDLVIENFSNDAAVYTYNDQYGIYELYRQPKGKGSNMDVYYSVKNQLVIFPAENTGGSTHTTVNFTPEETYISCQLVYNNGKFDTGCFRNGEEITYEEYTKTVSSYENQYYIVDGNVNQLIGTLEELI